MTILSVDPGRKGALVALDEDKGWFTHNLQYDNKKLNSYYFLSLLKFYKPSIIIIEKQTTYRRQSIKAGQTIMANYGRLIGLSEAWCKENHGEILTPSPIEWQKVIIPNVDKGETKKASIARVQKKYPNIPLLATTRSRTPSDGIADAVNMIDWYLQTNK